jgi:hypothetical protein
VSPFAAGCARCGADLDMKRFDSGPTLGNRIGSWFSALGSGPTKGGMTPLIVILLVFFSGSIIGLFYYLFGL